MNLSPNVFPCVEYYLSKFKKLIILCIYCQLDLKEDQCIYLFVVHIMFLYLPFMSL
jgi:hypothetical protein